MWNVVRTHRHRHVFGFAKYFITPGTAFAASATGLGTTKRLAQIAHVLAVHKTHASFNSSRHAVRTANVFGPNIARQTILNVVGQFNGVCFIAEWDQASHRSEDFVLRNLHAVVDVGKHGGPNEVAFLHAFRKFRRVRRFVQATTQKGVNTDKETIQEYHLEPATQDEIDHTVAVMGGEDWEMWISALAEAGVLAEGAKTTAYTYIGEKITWDIYWHGTIGAAKQDLDHRVLGLRNQLASLGGDARVSVLKAVVTQASAAIPAMPIYLAILFKVMKARGVHEGCIEQVNRLFREQLYGEAVHDEAGRLRVDQLELDPAVQAEVAGIWEQIDTDNLKTLADFDGYRQEFLQLFGFGIEGVDYDAEVDPEVSIPQLVD